MTEEEQNKLIENLRRNRVWTLIISFTGLFFILFLAWKFMVHDPYFKNREPVVQLVLSGLVVLGVFRYILFIRQQLPLSAGKDMSNAKKLELYYKRSFYFWLFDGIMTTGVAVFFLYWISNII